MTKLSATRKVYRWNHTARSAEAPLVADLPLLTESQRDLLAACVALGTADHVRLAAHLYVSPSTILKTSARISKRPGTRSRTDAILLAIREGIVPPRRAASRADLRCTGKKKPTSCGLSFRGMPSGSTQPTQRRGRSPCSCRRNAGQKPAASSCH